MVQRLKQSEDFAALYRRPFTDFGTSALWSSRAVRDPTPADALAITRTLRVGGDLRARLLAEQIEQACRWLGFSAAMFERYEESPSPYYSRALSGIKNSASIE